MWFLLVVANIVLGVANLAAAVIARVVLGKGRLLGVSILVSGCALMWNAWLWNAIRLGLP